MSERSAGRGRSAAVPFIYLASQSARRADLLRQLGVAHRLLVPHAEEDAEALEAERPGEVPAEYVRRVTLAKLAAARDRLRASGWERAPILCADTTVALGRRILGKPADAADARRTLRLLAGRTHRVITAVVLASARREAFAASTSRVRFASLSAAQIGRYVDGGEPFGKAGAYAIQGAAAAWIERIEGSYTGIMGLPLYETARLLDDAGVSVEPPVRTPCKTS